MSSNTPVPKTILGRNRDMSHYDPASDSRSVQAQASVCPPAHAYPSGGSISSLSSAGKQARRASTVHHIRKGRDHFGIKSRLATPSPPNPKANAASTRRAYSTHNFHYCSCCSSSQYCSCCSSSRYCSCCSSSHYYSNSHCCSCCSSSHYCSCS